MRVLRLPPRWVLAASLLACLVLGMPVASTRGQGAGTQQGGGATPVVSDLEDLRVRIDQVLQYYKLRMPNTAQHNAWEVMHWIVAYGVDAQVRDGGPQGPPQNAVGWMCFNRTFRGTRMLSVQNGRVVGNKGVGVQGHHGQFLAILAQSYLVREYPLRVDGQSFTVEDLLESEMLTCEAGQELTFKLIACAHYLPSDAQWRNFRGELWSIERLIREEIKQPVLHGAACGGTHRLMGLSYAVHKRRREGKPVDGEFARAEQYVRDFHAYTFALQNDDGSFSTAWLQRREARPDLDRRLQTSGHILEWLAFSLPDDELASPEMLHGMRYLTQLLADHPQRGWNIGPLGHALRALVIYQRRLASLPQSEVPEPPPAVVEDAMPQQGAMEPASAEGTVRNGSAPHLPLFAPPPPPAAANVPAASDPQRGEVRTADQRRLGPLVPSPRSSAAAPEPSEGAAASSEPRSTARPVPQAPVEASPGDAGAQKPTTLRLIGPALIEP